MQKIGIWKIGEQQPSRLQRTSIELEKQLEDWIEGDPSLIQVGLVIVGRQLHTDAGILDLLGLDPVGNWVVIEIKRGNVRRDTVMQAVDYAACIAEMPANELREKVNAYLKPRKLSLSILLNERSIEADIPQERQIKIMVVGTGRDPQLKRMTKFLSGLGKSIGVINFEVFEDSSGQKIIVREITEVDDEPITNADLKASIKINQSSTAKPVSEIDRLFKLAEQNGIGKEFRLVFDAATKHGLYPRTYKWSIMFTPPSNKSRVLICSYVKPTRNKTYKLFFAASAFAEFYPIGEREVTKTALSQGTHELSFDKIQLFVNQLDTLFTKIDKASE
jgi:hypothetical protein